jgi:hypothetical protein
MKLICPMPAKKSNGFVIFYFRCSGIRYRDIDTGFAYVSYKPPAAGMTVKAPGRLRQGVFIPPLHPQEQSSAIVRHTDSRNFPLPEMCTTHLDMIRSNLSALKIGILS